MEIKPQELRLGNIIQREVWGEGVVTKIGPDGFVTIQPKKLMGEISCTCIELSGIELTPEWLDRSSCTKANDNEHYFLNHHGFCVVFDGDDWCLKARIDQPYIICYFKYLHQLQNIYHILKGEELAIDKTSLKN